MRDWNAMSDEEFRQAAIDFIQHHCPEAIRFREERPRWEEIEPWYHAMSREGWLAPGWPAEYGGMALKPGKHLIYLEEWTKNGVPRAMEQGVINVGPALLAMGTQEQRDHYLPRILSGEDLWCQGFSEPGAGSDLAGLRTEAVIEGDEFVVNGQKIWTSGAYDANRIFVLARTDKSVAKQKGISFILMDMDQPGITVKPIVTVTGEAEFAEVFLDQARAPVANLVGGMNRGWTVAKSLLAFERVWAGSPHMGRSAMAQLVTVVRAAGLDADAVTLDRVAELKLELEDNAAMYEALAQEIREGHTFGFEVSTLKIAATETFSRITDLMVEIAGDAAAFGNDSLAGSGVDIPKVYLNSKPPMIYGGTVQVHRNILAKGVLGLPS